jgi:hypothetical protein
MARSTLARPLLGSLNNVVRAKPKCNTTVVFDAAVLGYPFED